MSYTLRSRFLDSYHNHATALATLRIVEVAAEELKIIDLDAYVEYGTNDYKTVDGEFKDFGPYIKLEPRHTPGIAFMMSKKGPTLEVVDTTPTLGEAAKILLPMVGHFDKSYDEDNNEIMLTATYKGVRIILADTPPKSCTVEKIEEEIEVPEKVIAAHKEKSVRYKLVGDCAPLMEKEKISLDTVAAPGI